MTLKRTKTRETPKAKGTRAEIDFLDFIENLINSTNSPPIDVIIKIFAAGQCIILNKKLMVSKANNKGRNFRLSCVLNRLIDLAINNTAKRARERVRTIAAPGQDMNLKIRAIIKKAKIRTLEFFIEK